MSSETVVAELIAVAGIKRVIVVDDAFAASSAQFLEMLAGFSPEQRAKVTGLDALDLEVDEIWQARVRELWEQADQDGRVAMVDNAYSYDQELQPLASGAVETLRRLLPDDQPEGYTLAQWTENRAQVLNDMKHTPTLVLFDQDFQHEQDGGPKTGQRLVNELEIALKGDPTSEDVYYGILTNTVRPEDEHVTRLGIVKEADVDPGRFVLISKQHLQGESSTFAARLRTTLLAPVMARLTAAASHAIGEAHKQALDKVTDISPEDMERMVIRGSAVEGIWEPDTLIRIFEIVQRQKVRRDLREEEPVAKLTRRLRDLAQIDTDQLVIGMSDQEGAAAAALETQNDVTIAGTRESMERHDPDAAASQSSGAPQPKVDGDGGAPAGPLQAKLASVPVAIGLQHDEIYDGADHVNALHLPLELGDLFSKSGSDKRYVLIAQPCDLSIRRGGKRMPDLSHFLLAEVVSDGKEHLFETFELPYFKRSEESAFVRLARPVYTRALVLDACVLNANGRAKVNVNEESPDALLPHWRDRHKEIKNEGKSMLSLLEEIQKDKQHSNPQKTAFRKAVAGHVMRDPFGPKTADAASGVIEWNCQRVGRVLDPYARALLTRFSQYFARDAYLMDLARL